MKTHQLVGYDPVSERPEFSLQVPDAQLYAVFRFDPDDSEGVFAYRLDYSKVSDLTGIMRRGKPPGNLEYFIEPYP